MVHAYKAQHLGVELGSLETQGQLEGQSGGDSVSEGYRKLEPRFPMVNVMFLCRDGDSRCPGPGG